LNLYSAPYYINSQEKSTMLYFLFGIFFIQQKNKVIDKIKNQKLRRNCRTKRILSITLLSSVSNHTSTQNRRSGEQNIKHLY